MCRCLRFYLCLFCNYLYDDGRQNRCYYYDDDDSDCCDCDCCCCHYYYHYYYHCYCYCDYHCYCYNCCCKRGVIATAATPAPADDALLRF